jgi:NADPH:quinone reductase-like Zn-dependent oxidoreductase
MAARAAGAATKAEEEAAVATAHEQRRLTVSAISDGRVYEFPVVIGRDYSGVVRAAGRSVTRWKPGDAVFGYLGGMTLRRGSFATHLLVGENECFTAKPGGVSFEEAACLPLSGVIALRCVADVRPDDTVVVLGVRQTLAEGSRHEVPAAR